MDADLTMGNCTHSFEEDVVDNSDRVWSDFANISHKYDSIRVSLKKVTLKDPGFKLV